MTTLYCWVCRRLMPHGWAEGIGFWCCGCAH